MNLLSVEVWRDSATSTIVSVYQERTLVDRVVVIPGDCLDLELEDGMSAVLSEMLKADEFSADRLAQAAIAELEDARG